MIIYEGPSQLDPTVAIVAIVTNGTVHDRASENEKTGPMAQIWILRVDRLPSDAVADHSDHAICGGCGHRGLIADSERSLADWDLLGAWGGRSCYVNIGRVDGIWRAYQRGKYERLTPGQAGARTVYPPRLGAYGDPAAVPIAVWRAYLAAYRIRQGRDRHTGYTHQWRTCAPAYRELLAASVDSPAEAAEARAAGWRTFRVRAASDPLLPGEIVCPASAENPRTTCARCGLCDGARPGDRRASIAIVAHGGTGARAFVTLQALRAARARA